MPSQKKSRLVCGDCPKTFGRLEHLRRHQKNHTGEKPFECPLCQRKFSRSDNRKQHISSHCSVYEQARLNRKLPPGKRAVGKLLTYSGLAPQISNPSRRLRKHKSKASRTIDDGVSLKPDALLAGPTLSFIFDTSGTQGRSG